MKYEDYTNDIQNIANEIIENDRLGQKYINFYPDDHGSGNEITYSFSDKKDTDAIMARSLTSMMSIGYLYDLDIIIDKLEGILDRINSK